MSISNAFTKKFTHSSYSHHGGTTESVYTENLYDWLYEREYEAWFCNSIKGIFHIRVFKEFLLKIHTGESLVGATPDWPWDKRQDLGQQYLERLSQDFLLWFKENSGDKWTVGQHKENNDELMRRLEIDGYLFDGTILLKSEEEVLDVEAERGLLHSLYRSLSLERESEAFTFLDLSEKHYVNGDWSDSIGNSRKFLELILKQVAVCHSRKSNSNLNPGKAGRPVYIREYLENEGLFEKREKETVDKIYGLLSHTGSHPYMAEKDQARLLRQLTLTTTQFVLLRLQGFLNE